MANAPREDGGARRSCREMGRPIARGAMSRCEERWWRGAAAAARARAARTLPRAAPTQALGASEPGKGRPEPANHPPTIGRGPCLLCSWPLPSGPRHPHNCTPGRRQLDHYHATWSPQCTRRTHRRSGMSSLPSDRSSERPTTRCSRDHRRLCTEGVAPTLRTRGVEGPRAVGPGWANGAARYQ